MSDSAHIKNALIERCKQHQLSTIENLKREMDEHQQMANDYGPPRDRYDAFRSQMLRRRDIFAEQLQKANTELLILNSLDATKINKIVELGSVIITDKQRMFVSISLGKIDIEGETYICISPAVPVFKALAGLKKGETTSFNNQNIQITNVF